MLHRIRARKVWETVVPAKPTRPFGRRRVRRLRMPPPVRRSAFVLAVTLALVLAGTALAGNGGVAPPAPASPGAQSIRSIYWLILAVTAGIFLLVTVTLVLFIVR